MGHTRQKTGKPKAAAESNEPPNIKCRESNCFLLEAQPLQSLEHAAGASFFTMASSEGAFDTESLEHVAAASFSALSSEDAANASSASPFASVFTFSTEAAVTSSLTPSVLFSLLLASFFGAS